MTKPEGDQEKPKSRTVLIWGIVIIALCWFTVIATVIAGLAVVLMRRI